GAEHASNHAARAAEGVQHKVAWIEAAFHRDFMDEVADLGGSHAVDPEGRLLSAYATRARDFFAEDSPRASRVELHAAAEEDSRVHVTDEHEHVGQGRLRAA